MSCSHPGTLVENAYDNKIGNDQLSEDSVTDTGDVPNELAELQTTTAMSDENTAAAVLLYMMCHFLLESF